MNRNSNLKSLTKVLESILHKSDVDVYLWLNEVLNEWITEGILWRLQNKSMTKASIPGLSRQHAFSRLLLYRFWHTWSIGNVWCRSLADCIKYDEDWIHSSENILNWPNWCSVPFDWFGKERNTGRGDDLAFIECMMLVRLPLAQPLKQTTTAPKQQPHT